MNINVTFEQDNMDLKPKFEEFVKAGTTESCTVFYPNVSDEGIISWTNNGDLPNPKPVNIKGKDGKNGLPGADGQNGIDGKDGNPGADGVSATHAWNGTVLTITSASGTSSADLKGDPGKDGQNGIDGKDGYTPVKGTDYWTQADKAEIVAQVLSALPVYNGEVV